VNSDGDDFAMKIIDRKRLGGHTSLTKIKKEIAIHYKLRHPHIVTLYRSFEDEFNVYMLLEYCPNGTLLDHLQFYPSILLNNFSNGFLKEEERSKPFGHF
jgi:polo-like kinase 4